MQPPDSASSPPAAIAFTRDSAARDSGLYATPALRALVADAALGNRVPPALASYRAEVESEFAVTARREDGLEGVFGVEQVASVLRWTRAGYYDQHYSRAGHTHTRVRWLLRRRRHDSDAERGRRLPVLC